MTALVIIPPDSVALLERHREHAKAISAIVDVAPLDDPGLAARAGELLRVIATFLGENEAERTALKRPYLDAGREIDATFREPKADLERVEALIRRRLGEAARRREEARTAALALAATAARAGDATAANSAIASISAPVAALEGVAEAWTWECVGVELVKVPVDYLSLDMDMVRATIADANRAGREPSVPGLTFERKVTHRVAKIK